MSLNKFLSFSFTFGINKIHISYKLFSEGFDDTEMHHIEVNVENCNVRIYYDDNRRAGRSWDIELKNNKFVMFPSTQIYYISNNQKDKVNFILKTTYEYI